MIMNFKGTFKIPYKISCPYIERCYFVYNVENIEFSGLKASFCETQLVKQVVEQKVMRVADDLRHHDAHVTPL